ncbi:alpha/beta hydrolase [Janibacter cremeus]|uniref:alpha/beta hydrolase n=1 Tax=Janibacter cremeus TaxID=1285192 RepID=UPI0023F82594|nr:alpha/beta fold hydrolase [Janibacter cremeus]WEV76879.1 alpha/beta hydrolase [Janibacter cremeus]
MWVRRVGIAAALVVGVLAVLVGAAWAFQRSLVFVPDSSPVTAPDDVREVTFTTSDDLELTAWLVEPGAGVADREVAVLYAPGNGGNRGGRIGIGRALVDEGFTVLLMDYRGYGGNPGNPSEEGLAKDATAAVEVLRSEGFAPGRTLYLGESIGTGVVARLQADRPPAGMLLRSPFTSFVDVGSHHYPFLPVGLLMRDRFPVETYVTSSDVPTTIVYGTDDEIVPAEQSARVADTAGRLEEVVALDRVGHNDPQMFGRPVVEALVRLADAHVGVSAP